MLNYFNFKRIKDDYLLTNDLGMFIFLTPQEFRDFLAERITCEDTCYEVLRDNCFIYDKPSELFIRGAAERLRELKSYVFQSTALHIFAVTNGCNMSCIYCQARDPKSYSAGMMTEETGKRAIELAMQSPSKHLTFEFQGGEPLLNFDVVKAMIEHSEALRADKTIERTIVTNLLELDDQKLQYLIEHNVSICTSLDGCATVHNQNRRSKNGGDSYNIVKEKIGEIRKAGRMIGAIETTTRYSLDFPIEIVKSYLEMGLNSIFIRPLTPLGFAKSRWDEIGYTADKYLNFYEKAFNYILELNASGIYFPEIHATYFLKKILGGYSDNYMELRSPCGAGIGQMSYYYDGNVYTCDEGRMLSEKGVLSFLLGNVYHNTYDELVDSSICKATCAASVVESLPSCCDCAYNPYCGVCPVVSYAERKNIFPGSPGDYRCRIYKGMLDILFNKIYEGNETTMRIFENWIGGCD